MFDIAFYLCVEIMSRSDIDGIEKAVHLSIVQRLFQGFGQSQRLWITLGVANE